MKVFIDGEWNSYGGELISLALRDWFATHASEYDIRTHQVGPLREVVTVGSDGRKSISLTGQRSREEARYAYADAMLKAREA